MTEILNQYEPIKAQYEALINPYQLNIQIGTL